MKLTGKSQKQFEEWYLVLIRQERKDYDKFSDEQVLAKFYRLLSSQQWGVIQDWADLIGIELEVNRYWDMSTEEYDGFCHYVQYYSVKDPDAEYTLNKTRQEARNAAIEKLNQLINEQ